MSPEPVRRHEGGAERAASDVQIRNLERGQVIEVDVRAPWTEVELEQRLMRMVAVRQPAELRVALEAGSAPHLPSFARARAALADFGGTLTVTFDGDGDRSAAPWRPDEEVLAARPDAVRPRGGSGGVDG